MAEPSSCVMQNLFRVLRTHLRSAAASDGRDNHPMCPPAVQAMCSLLFLACIALALPTASRQLYPGSEFSHQDLLSISHGTAVMLVIV